MKGVSPVKTGTVAKKKVTAKKGVLKAKSDKRAHAHARKTGIYFSEETLQGIFDRIALGEPVVQICAGPGMPTRKSLYEWIAADKDIERRYAVALTSKADKYMDETIGIADDGARDKYIDKDGNERTDNDVLGRSKLRVETRMRYAALIAPKKYGAHQTMDIDLNVSLKSEEVDDRIEALIRKAAGGR